MVGSLGVSSSMSSAAPATATYTRVATPSEAWLVTLMPASIRASLA